MKFFYTPYYFYWYPDLKLNLKYKYAWKGRWSKARHNPSLWIVKCLLGCLYTYSRKDISWLSQPFFVSLFLLISFFLFISFFIIFLFFFSCNLLNAEFFPSLIFSRISFRLFSVPRLVFFRISCLCQVFFSI